MIKGCQSRKIRDSRNLFYKKTKNKRRAETNKLITAGICDLEKENELNKAIKAGKEEEFLDSRSNKKQKLKWGCIKDLEEAQQKRIEDLKNK